MFKNLQSLKGKTKLKFYKSISNLYDEMKIRIFKIEEDASSKNANGIGKIYHEVLLLMKCLQTKPQVKNMNLNYHDLYYTVIKNRDDKEIVKNKNENDYYPILIETQKRIAAIVKFVNLMFIERFMENI